MRHMEIKESIFTGTFQGPGHLCGWPWHKQSWVLKSHLQMFHEEGNLFSLFLELKNVHNVYVKLYNLSYLHCINLLPLCELFWVLHVCVSKWMWGLTWFSLRGSLWSGRFYIFSPHTHAHTHTYTHTHTLSLSLSLSFSRTLYPCQAKWSFHLNAPCTSIDM